MNINPELQPLLKPSDNMAHPNESILTPLFSLLSTTNKTIAPWIEPTFWSNMLNKECFTFYFQDLFKDLANNTQIGTNSELMNSIITTIFHLIFSYHSSFPKNLILPYYDKLIELNNQDISHMLIYLEKNSTSLDFSSIISRFNPNDMNLSAGNSIPLFTLHGLLHQLRMSKENQNDFMSTVIDKLQMQLPISQAQIILHLIRVCISFFDIEPSKLTLIKESLYKFYDYDSSVSGISSDLIHLLDKSIKYPLYGFHSILNQMSHISEAFGCQIPLIFNAKYSNISTYLYNDSVDRSSYLNAYISYPKYFIHRYFNSQPPGNVGELQRFMYNLKFSKKYLQTVPQAFKLAPADPRYIRPVLTLPVHQFQFNRITTNLKMNPDISTPINHRMFIITSPIEAVLNQSFFAPIYKYFIAFDPNDIDRPTEQQILVIGSDHLLSTIVSTLVLWILKNPALGFIEFQIFFVPIGNSQYGDFISNRDVIYNIFVRNLYRTVSSILPTYNETSGAFFPKFVPTNDPTNKYENNIWFSNPSPSHLFQFGLQHYLMFAQNKMTFYIWQCRIVLADSNKVVTIPFIGSVIIDTNDQKRSFETSIGDYKKNQMSNEFMETKTMALYNVNYEKRANPNKDYLILDTGSLRLVFSAIIATPKIKPIPFFVDIDGKKYGPVLEIQTSCLFMDNTNTAVKIPDPMRMKIRTFVDI
ncbi:hypothetical protein M9Y10_023531 [Tritrichomonas musculus]|uniref:Uncharacterized protein n=1 Tax=Tritrichomonas musculus TaxID=1915356 RepID=A0ABR2KVE1_9EUKA